MVRTWDHKESKLFNLKLLSLNHHLDDLSFVFDILIRPLLWMITYDQGFDFITTIFFSDFVDDQIASVKGYYISYCVDGNNNATCSVPTYPVVQKEHRWLYVPKIVSGLIVIRTFPLLMIFMWSCGLI